MRMTRTVALSSTQVPLLDELIKISESNYFVYGVIIGLPLFAALVLLCCTLGHYSKPKPIIFAKNVHSLIYDEGI